MLRPETYIKKKDFGVKEQVLLGRVTVYDYAYSDPNIRLQAQVDTSLQLVS